MLLGYGFGVIWWHPGFEAICIFEFRIQCFGIISDICAKSATPRNFLKLPKSSAKIITKILPVCHTLQPLMPDRQTLIWPHVSASNKLIAIPPRRWLEADLAMDKKGRIQSF
jgi:hypothetical protein